MSSAISLLLSSHSPGFLKESSCPVTTWIHTQRLDLLEMASFPHRCHGNFAQRRATLLPREAKCRVRLKLEAMSSETDPNLATTTEEQTPQEEKPCSAEFCKMEKESCDRNAKAASPSSEKREKNPDKNAKALLKRIRIHPEAQRILGNSCIAVVSLERLNFQSVSLSCLQPVVSLVRLPCQTQAELHDDVSLNCPQQNGFMEKEADILEIREGSPQLADLSQTKITPLSWTEPYCPYSSMSGEPEQDSSFDCESNPDQPYILFDSGTEDGKSDSETFYLDPDPEQTMVVELEPEAEAEAEVEAEVEAEAEAEADQHRNLQLEDKFETKCEADIMDVNQDQRPDFCSSQVKEESSIQQTEAGAGTEEMESEDFCAVCLNGGDLLCCDRCPKVYHLACHIPSLICFPLGDWVCTLCRTDQEPVEAYDCENMHSCGGIKAPYTLSSQDQRRCENLTLLLYCHRLSAPFHEPVSPLARNYYQIIKRPIDLSVIRRKLDESNTLHYFTAEQFIDDVLLMFKNCSTFNYPDSEVAQAGQNLEVFFLRKLKDIFPDRTFPSASQDRTVGARLKWLNRKRKENYRKKRYVFSGKKYYL